MFTPSAASKYVKLPSGATARYVERPAFGPALVLLHGGSCSLESWDAVADRLQDRARIIALDMPGHGLTGPTPQADYSPRAMTGFLHEFILSLGLDRFAIAGHSMGGHVAWRYALEHPERVSNLALVAPGGLADPTGVPGVGMKFSASEEGRAVMRAAASRERTEMGLRAMFHVQEAVTPDVVDRNWAMASRQGALEATQSRFQAPMFEPAAIARLDEIAAPTLVIWGKDDNVFALELSRMLTGTIGDCQLMAYERCGHFPHEEYPERTADDISEFLRE
jgi:pimeloyl-ACP methyl ester carboxylesterase